MLDMARDMVNAFHVSFGHEYPTGNVHGTGGNGGQNAGGGNHYEFNFYGDMNVRDDDDVRNVAHELYEEIQEELRGGRAVCLMS